MPSIILCARLYNFIKRGFKKKKRIKRKQKVEVKLLCSWRRETCGGNMWLWRVTVSWRQSLFSVSQIWQNGKKKSHRANRNHNNSDAMLLIAMFLFLQLCKFVIMCWVTTLFVFYTLQENIICKAANTITTIPRSPLFKIAFLFQNKRRKPSSTCSTLHQTVQMASVDVAAVLPSPALLTCLNNFRTWKGLEKAKLIILATMIDFLFILVTTFFWGVG